MRNIGRVILVTLLVSHPLNYKPQNLQLSEDERIKGVDLSNESIDGYLVQLNKIWNYGDIACISEYSFSSDFSQW